MKKRIDPKLPIAPVAGDDPARELMQPDRYFDRLVRRLNELFRESDDGTIALLDEGIYLGQANALNFVGDAVTASLSSTTGTILIDASNAATVQTISAVAVEALAAGQFVAVYDASGTPKCRIAKSSSGQGFQADGFVKDAFALGATATIYLPGQVNVAGGTGLTAGDVFLGTDGYATNTAPTTTGYISQQIGVAENATHVAFEPQPDILIAAAHATGTGGIVLKDEGVTLGTILTLDIVGASLAATISGTDGTLTGTGSGGSSQTLYVYFP